MNGLFLILGEFVIYPGQRGVIKHYKQGSDVVRLVPLKVNPGRSRDVGVKEV